LAHDNHRDSVAKDVTDQLKEGEDDGEGREARKDQRKVGRILAHDIVVEQERKLDTEGAAKTTQRCCDIRCEAAGNALISSARKQTRIKLVHRSANARKNAEG